MSVATNLLGTIPGIIGRPGESIEGVDTGEWILGTEVDDVVDAAGGDDFVQAQAGNDEIDAGDGNDTVLGGEGDDTIAGGIGDDVVRGDAGADAFLFDPSQEEGSDTIVDFNPEEGDVIALSAAGLATLGLEEFTGAALDASEEFNLVEEEETGDLVIEHPGGTIALNGVPFAEEGQEAPTFEALEAAGLLTIPGLLQGTDAGEELVGTEEDDVIDASGGDDIITPLGGDDVIITGAGRDQINLDPSNSAEGDDTITDFSAPSDLDSTVGDFLALQSSDVLAADPDLAVADGDATTLSLADFDASANWTLGSSETGNLLLTHPGGSVEFTNATFNGQQFADLGAMILVDGEEFDEPILLDSSDGEDVPDEDAIAGGEDLTDGEPEPAEPIQPEEEAIA